MTPGPEPSQDSTGTAWEGAAAGVTRREGFPAWTRSRHRLESVPSSAGADTAPGHPGSRRRPAQLGSGGAELREGLVLGFATPVRVGKARLEAEKQEERGPGCLGTSSRSSALLPSLPAPPLPRSWELLAQTGAGFCCPRSLVPPGAGAEEAEEMEKGKREFFFCTWCSAACESPRVSPPPRARGWNSASVSRRAGRSKDPFCQGPQEDKMGFNLPNPQKNTDFWQNLAPTQPPAT